MKLCGFDIGLNQPLLLIAGTCSIEGLQMSLDVAGQHKAMCDELSIPLIYKGSFDKANRSSGNTKRGLGMDEGLRILDEVRRQIGVPILTDVHEIEQIKPVADVVDVLQTPAFLCRQTDFIRAVAQSGKPVNIKKGQFLAPWDTVNIGEKMRAFGCDEFMMCERGTSFGYNNLVVDMRSLYWMKQEGFPVVFDATHAVQRPGGLGGTTGGDSELAPVLASAAMATGSIDGVFMEVHKDPSKALSDGPNQIPLHLLEGVLKRLQSIHQAVQS